MGLATIDPHNNNNNNNNNNLLISSAQVSTIRFSNARYKSKMCTI